MNQEKIGKFIAKCRKNKKLTQEQLAENLNVSDRAVSKWENGICMPDVSNILKLCKILDITINDLFSGEIVIMKEYNKKVEENLLELAKKEEASNKKLLFSMYVLMGSSLLFYILTLLIGAFFIPEGSLQLIIILISTILLFIVIFFAIKIEVDAGYYECKNCHHKFVATYKQVLWAMHIGTTRYLKCPKCNKSSWSKKVLKK